jgi:hypothetical protein
MWYNIHNLTTYKALEQLVEIANLYDLALLSLRGAIT